MQQEPPPVAAGFATQCLRQNSETFGRQPQQKRVFFLLFCLFLFLGTRYTSKYAIWFICASFNSHPIFLTQQIDASICFVWAPVTRAVVGVCAFVYLFNRLSRSKSFVKCSRIALHAQCERNGTRHRHNSS